MNRGYDDMVDSVVHRQALLDPRQLHDAVFRSAMDSWDVVDENEQPKALDWGTIELAS